MLTQRFAACPLCSAPVDSAEVYKVGNATSHPLYKPELPATLRWLRCRNCQHVFTESYWNEAGAQLLFSSALAHQLPDASQSEHLRKLWASVVSGVAARLAETRTRERVFGTDGNERARWLDIGFGNGGLVMCADEFGFAALGVDVRAQAVQRLSALGYVAICARFEELELDRPVAVLSMADALEHMSDPRAALRKAHSMLDPDGLLYLSCPNSATSTWRLWEEADTNPYWGELEHYHNFSRSKLLTVLEEHGFKVVNYDVSVRYYSCMELTARKC